MPTDLNKDAYSKEVPTPPVNQTLPVQERGVRRARALPYALHAHGARIGDAFRIDFDNVGMAAAVFQVRSGNDQEMPKTYTVEANQSLSDSWSASTGYDLSVYGPNGFFRSFKGSPNGPANLDIKACYDKVKNGITLNIANLAQGKAKVRILDKYTGRVAVLALQNGVGTSRRWSLGLFSGWYDLIVTVEGDAGFEYRLAGHVETGKDSISDPMMGGLI